MEDYSMNTQLIRNWMTPHPITITPPTTLTEAQQLMLDYHIRRLPVVDKDKLVGIVTRRDINRAQSSAESTLSLHELNLTLERLTAREYMSHTVHTISPDATIGEAARLMLEHQ